MIAVVAHNKVVSLGNRAAATGRACRVVRGASLPQEIEDSRTVFDPQFIIAGVIVAGAIAGAATVFALASLKVNLTLLSVAAFGTALILILLAGLGVIIWNPSLP